MEYLKLYCDRYHCDTEFLVKIKYGEEIKEYYIYPECEGVVHTDDDENTILKIKQCHMRHKIDEKW